jgi:hypothetical protein
VLMDAERVFAAAQAVETPVAVVDVAAMESNLAAMQSRAAGLGLRLRPHAKTHKSAFVARRQLEHGATGLTAATLTEAEVFAAAGAGDLLIAFPPVGVMRLRRLAALVERVVRLAVSTDSVEVAATLPERVEVLWEVDSGHHRVGTAPGAATVAGVTALVAASGHRGLDTRARPGRHRRRVQGPRRRRAPVPAPRLRERGRARGPGAGEDERGARDARRHGWSDRAAHRRPPPGHPGPLLHHGQPPSGRADGRGGDGMVGPGGGARLAGNSRRRDARPSGGG